MGRGKVNGQLSVVTSVGRKRMGKASAVQNGRALPMGRCASPPCPKPRHSVNTTIDCVPYPYVQTTEP